jgi:hypothetical protein
MARDHHILLHPRITTTEKTPRLDVDSFQARLSIIIIIIMDHARAIIKSAPQRPSVMAANQNTTDIRIRSLS